MRTSSARDAARAAAVRSASASAPVARLQPRRQPARAQRVVDAARPRSRASASSAGVDTCTPKKSPATSSIWWASSKITASCGGSTCASGHTDRSARSAKYRWWLVDDHVRLRRPAPHLRDEAALVVRAARADARLGLLAISRQCGLSSGRSARSARSPLLGLVDPGAQALEHRIGDQRRLAFVKRRAAGGRRSCQALHHRERERPRQHALQPRQVLARDLILQRLGRGADDDLASRQDGGHQVRQRLAGARARLDQQALVLGQRAARCAPPSPVARAGARSPGRPPPGAPPVPARRPGSLLPRRLFVDAGDSEAPAKLVEHAVDRHARRLQPHQHVEQKIGRLVRGVGARRPRAAPRPARPTPRAACPGSSATPRPAATRRRTCRGARGGARR